MATQAGTIELLAQELGRALQPLEKRLSAGQVEGFLEELGIRLPSSLAGGAEFVNALASAASGAAGLAPLILRLTNAISAGDAAQIVAAGSELLSKIIQVLQGLAQIGASLDSVISGAGSLTPEQRTRLRALAEALPRRLFDYTVIEYLRAKGSNVVPTLSLLGLIDETTEGNPDDPLTPPFLKRELQVARLFDIFLKPETYLRDSFGWGDPDFDGSILFSKVSSFLEASDLPVVIITAPDQPPVLEAFLFRLSPDTSAKPHGLSARLRIPAIEDFQQDYRLGSLWALTVEARARFETGLEATLRPLFDVSLHPPSGTISIELSAGFAAQHGDKSPVVLLGQAGGSRLEVERLAFSIGFLGSLDSASGAAKGEPSATAELTGGKAFVDLSSSDGFIKSISGGAKLEANLGFKAHWAPSTGLRLEGSSSIEIAIPAHISLGPIEIQTIYLMAGLDSSGSIPLELSGAFSVNLGPLKASIDRIGLSVQTTFPEEGGNLGSANLAFSFKPPNGVGLSVDAGIVKGGGFLFIDVARGEYAGALELVFSGIVNLKAIGIINTKMPDGSSGFSLLIIITAEFGTGFQLGFGFTLLAVGGLIGLNRTMRLQPLTEGVRTGAINSVMFPRDVVANAPRIISDLKTFFPPKNNNFLIGPMAKLGWGTPPLVSIALGIIIEIPGNIAILGVLKVALPVDDVAILILQVNFIGAIEFDRNRLYFFASLFGSRVLFITIDGEMGVLTAFGDDANFVISVGGFNPRFTPPPLPFPNPRRIAINILDTEVARVRVEGYFAVTTNTVQFGARAELFFGFDSLNVQGKIGFDALFQFSPFYFIIDVSASFSVRVLGLDLLSIDVHMWLEGPTPWRAHGTGSFRILFFTISVDFDITWGDRQDTTLPPIAVMPILYAELEKAENWKAVLPAGNNLLVCLRKLPEQEADMVLHPVGVLRISQRAVPLNLTLEKFGNQKPSDVTRLSVSVSSGGLSKKDDALEQFAPAQFQNLSDGDKLTRPAYGPEPGGLELSVAGQQLASSRMVKRVVRYKLIVTDTIFKSVVKNSSSFNASLFNFFVNGSSITKSELSKAQQSRLDPFEEKITVGPETYTVAFQENNRPFAREAESFTSEASAREYMKGKIAQDPNLSDKLHVIPEYEKAA